MGNHISLNTPVSSHSITASQQPVGELEENRNRLLVPTLGPTVSDRNEQAAAVQTALVRHHQQQRGHRRSKEVHTCSVQPKDIFVQGFHTKQLPVFPEKMPGERWVGLPTSKSAIVKDPVECMNEYPQVCAHSARTI